MVDGDDDLGLMFPDRSCEIPPQFETLDDQPVRMIEKGKVGDTNRSAAGILLAGPLTNRLLWIQRSDARLAPSDQEIANVFARAGPLGNRTRSPYSMSSGWATTASRRLQSSGIGSSAIGPA